MERHDPASNSAECFGLQWPGKAQARRLAETPTNGVLRPCSAESVRWDATQNLFIEGDNLDVLKLLRESHGSRVKMIYIDPPYNTGQEFIYSDDFQDRGDSASGFAQEPDGEGFRFTANREMSGRYHAGWLSMIYPRLVLARDLLRQDGVLFISIDDHEAAHLRTLCNEVFGEDNHLVTLYIQVRYANKTLAEKNDYQKLVEQVHVYAKDRQCFVPQKQTREYTISKFEWKITELGCGSPMELGGKKVTLFREDEYRIEKIEPGLEGLKETWATGSVLKRNASGKYFGEHLAPRKATDGLKCLYKVDGIGQDGLGYRYFTGPRQARSTKGKFYSGVPLARREALAKGTAVRELPIENLWDFAHRFGNCRHEGGIDFRSGKKPTAFLKRLIAIAANEPGDVVLDFFAGSCSTAHAVLDLNRQDGVDRKFIMVQRPESCRDDADAIKEGCNTIAEIGMERIRRVIRSIEEDDSECPRAGDCGAPETGPAASPNLGFRVYKFDGGNV